MWDGMTATTEVSGATTAIPGLHVFTTTKVEDDRGWFQAKFHRAKLIEHGLPTDFAIVQTSVAFNRRGSTRGFHAEPWSKYVSLIDGRAFAAYVDLRAGETFGTAVTVELDSTTAVFVPAGVANSYQCLEDLHYLYSVDAHWSPDAYETSLFVSLADPDLAVEWPIPLDEALLSERDRSHPLLESIQPI